jgi:hypothetical protein
MLPILTLGAALFVAPPALAATASDAQTSANWAGYAATGSQFSKVSGSWVQPQASCDSSRGDAVFWVGIGGATSESSALEQTGTEVDCSSGSPEYSAWYELVPAAPVKIGLDVHPGDHISASVGVDGDQVSIALTDQTTGKSFNRTLQMDSPDTSSAEWIAEAPSVCQGDAAAGNCQPVSLADFGTASFTDSTATGSGQTGTAEQWGAQAMQLSSGAGGGSAAPSTLSGGAFSVAWSADSAQSGSGDPYGSAGSSDPYGLGGSGDPYGYGSDYGYGDGYGDGDGSGLGYDDGYGYGGYGDDGSGAYLYDGGPAGAQF